MITHVISAIGAAVGGFFGFKGKQAESVNKALEVVADFNTTEAARFSAAAQIISAEARSEGLLTRSWRPLAILILIFDFHLLAYWLITGQFPPELLDTLPPIMDKVLDTALLLAGVMGGGRALEKIAREFQIGGILKEFIKKKLL